MLIFNTISIWGNMGNVQTRGLFFFVAFIGAAYNRWLWNYKISQFTLFVRREWGLM